MQVITSTASNGTGLNFTINARQYNFDEPFPAGKNRITIKFDVDRLECQGSWMTSPVAVSDTAPNSKVPLLIAGDTDTDTIVDIVDYFIVRKFGPDPNVTVTQQSPIIWKVDIENTSANSYTEFQVGIPADSIVSSTTESLYITTAITKVLFGRGGNLYKWDGSSWVFVAPKDTIDETTFDNNGMLAPLDIDKPTIELLTQTPEIVAYIIGDDPVTSATCIVDFKPYTELIVPTTTKSISGLQSLTVTVNDIGTNGVIKLAVTHDLTHYYAWDGSTWVELTSSGLDPNNQSDIDNIINNGMDITTVNSLTESEWQLLYADKSDIAFAIAIQYNSITDVKKIDNVVVNVSTPDDTWQEDTHNNVIQQVTDSLIITINDTGTYRINYTD